MRLLHTSDWHLGRHLRTVSLVEHQRAFLTWLAVVADEHAVDAVLVSGDVYDRAIPSVEAVGLLEEGLVRLVRACPVVLISGNHDSPARLGFGGPLLASAGVHLRSDVDDVAVPVVLERDGQVVLVYGVPYLEPEVVRTRLDADKSHEAVLTAAMDRIRADLADRGAAGARPQAVVLAHAFVTGGVPSDSERDVSVGGVADAPAAVFHGVDYVALGHLHGPQRITNPEGPEVRYSGSPLAYSFSEEQHDKSVTLVDIAPDGTVTTEQVPTPVPRRLATVTGDLEHLIADPALAFAEDAWVRAIVTDAVRPMDAMDRLRERYPHAIELSWQPHADGVPITPTSRRVEAAGSDPVEVACAFIEHVTLAAPTPEQVRLVRDSVERVRIAEAGA